MSVRIFFFPFLDSYVSSCLSSSWNYMSVCVYQCFYCRPLIVHKLNIFQKIFSGTLSEFQTVWFQTRTVGPDLDTVCLLKLSADNKRCQKQRKPLMAIRYV